MEVQRGFLLIHPRYTHSVSLLPYCNYHAQNMCSAQAADCPRGPMAQLLTLLSSHLSQLRIPAIHQLAPTYSHAVNRDLYTLAAL